VDYTRGRPGLHLSTPLSRPLQVYAFDPSVGRRHGNHMTVTVPYEPLQPGPRGRRVEVVDFDGSNGCYYAPVDLDSRDVLLGRGLAPSEADPRFHQQMVYAVACKAIENFGMALGRQVEWTRRRRGSTRARPRPLRIFPHAMQEANAYYDAQRHALLFGYFAASASDVGSNLPGQTIYSCLSHDIVAHETAHALVHDIRRFFMEPTGPDTLAFHEAFADVVALFQHFSFTEAVRDHVMRTGGVLYDETLAPIVMRRRDAPEMGTRPQTLAEEAQRNTLVGLAQQFGEAMGLRAALRSALGTRPDPAELERRFEPHERGAILVAAVFDAFFAVYATRMADLLRIAGTGTQPAPGELSVDLANRLTAEATKTAGHFLNMCIRALDYCPPVDITFGDFLRALITADSELVPDDDRGYRDILIEAFRRRGIRPGDVNSYADTSLRWQPLETPSGKRLFCRGLQFSMIGREGPDVAGANAHVLAEFAERHAAALGLRRRGNGQRGIQPWTFHPVHRVGPDGQLRFEIVAELVQQDRVALSRGRARPRQTYRGGVTLVIDARDGGVRYAIYKRLDSKHRLERYREFWDRWRATLTETYGAAEAAGGEADFAFIHRGY
jgi:hypothetical protein